MQSRIVKSPFPAIFFRVGRLNPILIRHFRKVPYSPVHTETRKRHCQKIPLWRAFSKSCDFGIRFHRIRVDGSRNHNESCVLKRKRISVDGAFIYRHNKQLMKRSICHFFSAVSGQYTDIRYYVYRAIMWVIDLFITIKYRSGNSMPHPASISVQLPY